MRSEGVEKDISWTTEAPRPYTMFRAGFSPSRVGSPVVFTKMRRPCPVIL